MQFAPQLIFRCTANDIKEERPERSTGERSGDWLLIRFICSVGGELRVTVIGHIRALSNMAFDSLYRMRCQHNCRLCVFHEFYSFRKLDLSFAGKRHQA